MEVYVAKARFIPPSNSDFKLLSISPGEKFFILWKKNGPWWGGMSCSCQEVGYLASKYLEFFERLDDERTREAKLLIAAALDKRRSLDTQDMIHNHYDENLFPDIPEADYDDDDNDSDENDDEDDENGESTERNSSGNPCLECPVRRQLHKELMVNMKRGNPALKKTELQKELERRGVARQKREFEEYRLSQRTALEVKLAERHAMIKQNEEEALREAAVEASRSELERVQERIRRRNREQELDS